MSFPFTFNSCGFCCKQCDPCCMEYGQSSECNFGAEVEAIPQIFHEIPINAKKKSIKKSKEKKKISNSMKLPKTHITRKVKSDVLYSSWECCKRNGIQDETPQWLVLGRPYRRPGPSYRYRIAYYPTSNS